MTTISNMDDLIDVREVIARFEELEETECNPEEFQEMECLKTLLSDLQGNGGDEKWRGDWYPITLIRDSYFKDYAQELADECGMTTSEATWPYTCIDWDRAAYELRMDYTAYEFDGITYWTR